MDVRLGNSILRLKDLGCVREDIPAQPIPPSVNLFVKVTNGCNARCLFCSNAGAESVSTRFNVDKLFEMVNILQERNIIVNRINITGGEPAVVPALVDNILSRAAESPYADIHLHLNTNGLLPNSQMLMRHDRWNSISMSLHHYDMSTLQEIYGIAIPIEAFNFEGIDMSKVNASCNLIRGYIDSPESVQRMLDYAIDLGINRLGFVALMKTNDFCRQHYVDFSDVDFASVPRLHFTGSMNRGSDCKCSNYLYSKGTRILEVYMRNYMNHHYCESSMVYDGQYFRQGFGTNNIIY